MRYRCTRSGCLNNSIPFSSNHPPFGCPSCGAMIKQESEAPKIVSVTSGAIGGALLGFAVGGPSGAVLGLFLGSLFGNSAAENEKRRNLEGL